MINKEKSGASLSLPGRKTDKEEGLIKRDRRRSMEVRKYANEEKQEESLQITFKETIKLANQEIFKYANNDGRNKSAQNWDKIQIGQKKSHQKQFFWEVHKIQQKRKIKGIKAKLIWSNSKQGNWVIIRVVLASIFRQKLLDTKDYFIELDSSNIDMKIQQQKSLQKKINKLTKNSQKYEKISWLKRALFQLHQKLCDRPKSKQTQFKRTTINDKYILYPCPASITWSPHGLLCLSENKIGNFTKPILGSVSTYRNLIEVPYQFSRFARGGEGTEDLKMADEKREDEDEESLEEFLNWDVKDEVNFSVFGKCTREEEIESLVQKHRTSEDEVQKQQKKSQRQQETVFMGMVNSISLRLQKIYKRYFIGVNENEQFQFREKLKVYTVKSQVVQMQDGILYLIDKIQRSDRSHVDQQLLQNQFSGYPSIYNKDSEKGERKRFEKLKYELTSEFLQQKIKNTPQSQHFLFMKSILVQNQFFRLALQKYFQDSFKRLKINRKYQCLGTYDNFDGLTAQKLLFQLLQQHFKCQKAQKQSSIRKKDKYKQNPQKYDDPFYRLKKYRRMQEQNQQMRLYLKGYTKKKNKGTPFFDNSHEHFRKNSFQNYDSSYPQNQLIMQNPEEQKKSNRNVNLNIMPFLIVNRVDFIPFQFNFILTPLQRKNFIEAIIPILWIKDRSNDKFQYKMAKRVIIANSKIVNFFEIMGNFYNSWKKQESKRHLFLKSILSKYREHRQKTQKPIGKFYVAYCLSCKGGFTTYSIQQLLRVTKCSKCKFLQAGNDHSPVKF